MELKERQELSNRSQREAERLRKKLVDAEMRSEKVASLEAELRQQQAEKDESKRLFAHERDTLKDEVARLRAQLGESDDADKEVTILSILYHYLMAKEVTFLSILFQDFILCPRRFLL